MLARVLFDIFAVKSTISVISTVRFSDLGMFFAAGFLQASRAGAEFRHRLARPRASRAAGRPQFICPGATSTAETAASSSLD
jgi:hypothetical protein